MITYLQFLKKIYHTVEFRATSELILWIAIGCGVAWKANPNTFSNPGLEFIFVIFFTIHGLIRFVYLLFRTEIKP